MLPGRAVHHKEQGLSMSIALVVEDDPDIQVLFRTALQEFGFEVHITSSVAQALQVLQKVTPNVAFIDVNMPERPGTDVLTYIKSEPQLAKQVRTVVVTANSLVREDAEKLGADLVLLKPVQILEVIRLAERLIGY
jgi:two-component system OmpR family response regulator